MQNMIDVFEKIFEKPDDCTGRLLSVDFDGTLADTEPLHADSYKECLKEYGVNFTHEDMRQYIGSSEGEIISALSERYSIHINRESFSILRNKYVMNGIGCIYPYWFVIDLFRVAKKYGWFVLVLSSQKKYLIEMCIRRWNLEGFVDMVISLDSSAKRKSDLLLSLTMDFHVGSDSVVVMEDNEIIILMAKSLGYRTIGVSHSLNEMSNASPEYLINTL